MSVATTPQDPSPPDPEDALLVPGDEDLDASTEVMSLLVEHVPLTLLADLTSPTGPASPAILESEGLPDVAWWDAEEDDGLPDLVPDEPEDGLPDLVPDEPDDGLPDLVPDQPEDPRQGV